MRSASPADYFRDIVEQFSISYGVRPESTVLHDHSIRQVGFCLELYGRDGNGTLTPGDDRSKEIYRALREIAEQIVPDDDHNCRFALEDFHATLHYDSSPNSRAKVQLEIYILHKHGSHLPIDAQEARALHELEDRLKHLGVCRGK